MTTIVFSNTFGPTVRDKVPLAESFTKYTYMYHEDKWYWIESTQCKNKLGKYMYCKEWKLVPRDSYIPKEHKMAVLLLT